MKNAAFAIPTPQLRGQDINIEQSLLWDHPAGFNVFQISRSGLDNRVNYDVPTFIRRGFRVAFTPSGGVRQPVNSRA
jgi:hypothetical protein